MTRIDYNLLARDYASNRRLHPEVLKNLLSTAQLDITGRVLELGCGTANYITAIESAIGCKCVGGDASAGMVHQARQRAKIVGLHLTNAENPCFPNYTFNLVFSVDVIHHLDNYRRYFQNAHRLLKPGGKLCTVTDSESIIRKRQPLTTYFPKTVAPELKRYPRINYLKTLMRQAGFQDIAQESVEFAFALTDIQPYQDRAFSALHLISGDAFQAGLERMMADLQIGPIPCVSRYVLLWGVKPQHPRIFPTPASGL